MKIPCPQCKGRRVVFNPEGLLMNVFLPLVMFIESGDDVGDNSITKKPCPTCKGKGYFNCENDD